MTKTTTVALARNIKLLAWARAIRWVGWGFGEPLLPIFYLSFSSSFAMAGFFRAAIGLTETFALPLVGALADRVSARSLVIVGLCIYPFIGLSYYTAGAFGVGGMIVVARLLNGIAYPLESVGIDTYYRRMADSGSLLRSFGYIDTFAELGWILAACAGIFLTKYFPVHALLLLIIPSSLIAILLVLRATRDETLNTAKFVPAAHMPHMHRHVLQSYRDVFTEMRVWDRQLQLVAFLTFFGSIITAFIGFFIPIIAYTGGASLTMVILLAIGFALPSVLGYPLGVFANKRNPYSLVGWGLGIVAVGALLLALIPDFGIRFGVSFMLGIVLELFVIIGKSLITDIGAADSFGRRGSVFTMVSEMGDLSAPLVLGVAIDMIGFSGVAGGISIFALFLATCFLFFGTKQRMHLRAVKEIATVVGGGQ